MSTTRRQWSGAEHKLGKRVLKEYSTNEVHYNNGGDYWNLQIWLEFKDRYNYLAREAHLPLLNPREFLDLGRNLQSEFCMTRSRYKSYGYSDMEEVFNPCLDCRRRSPVFPKYVPGGPNSYSNTTSGTLGNESNEQELNSDGGRLKVVEQQVIALWLDNNLLSNEHVAQLFAEPRLREGIWLDFLKDDRVPNHRKASLLISTFCGGASTSGSR